MQSSSSSLRLQRRAIRDLASTQSFDDSFHLSEKRLSIFHKALTTPLVHQSRTRPFMIMMAMCITAFLFTLYLSPGFSFHHVRAVFCTNASTASDVSGLSNILLDRFAATAAKTRRPAQWAKLKTLVIVAGHAIYTSSKWDVNSLRDETNWLLEPFQKGQVSTFLKHIEKGVQLVSNDPTALLLFSGGQTRDGAGPRSEGMTYWSIANAANWFGHKSLTQTANRSFAEEYARDSFENLLFSICRFHQIVGSYPQVIKVVGFEFKRERFVNLHRRALRFPSRQFQYFGIDPDSKIASGKFGMAARERATAMGPFVSDPYGCQTATLYTKRLRRNPYLRYHPYPQGCPHLSRLFRHCGPSLFRDPLPWDNHEKPVSIPDS